jgi:hypothetical protein
VPVLQATYTFATDTQCWTASGGPNGTIVQLDSSDGPYTGSTNALEVIVPPMSGQQLLIGVQFPTGQTISTGSVLSFYYKVSSNATTLTGQVYDQSGSGNSWNGGDWQGSLSSSWANINYSMSPVSQTSVNTFGFQFPGVGVTTNSPVTIWFDAVTLTLAAPSTPTPTLTPNPNDSFYFTTSSVPSHWADSVGGSAVTLSSILMDPSTAGLTSSTYSMAITIGWSTNGDQFNLTYSYPSPANWTSLNLTGFSTYIQTNPVISTTGFPGLQLFVQSGNPTWIYDGNGGQSIPSNSWTQFSFTPSFTGTGENPAAVQQIGLNFYPGNTATGPFANPDAILVDDVQLY